MMMTQLDWKTYLVIRARGARWTGIAIVSGFPLVRAWVWFTEKAKNAAQFQFCINNLTVLSIFNYFDINQVLLY